MGERQSKMGESEEQNRYIYLALKKSKIGRKKLILSRPSYDDASAMSSYKRGVVKLIQHLEPRAMYTPCFGH